MDLTAFL
jgi:RNA recognition motif-containing protein